jgi:predicted metalloprotease
VRASAAVGDDRLQRKATGQVDPDSFIHGSSEQRAAWFNLGRESSEPAGCDTFSPETL